MTKRERQERALARLERDYISVAARLENAEDNMKYLFSTQQVEKIAGDAIISNIQSLQSKLKYLAFERESVETSIGATPKYELSDKNFFCIRVYANGDSKWTTRDYVGMMSWLRYNLTDRPGCSLFVNGLYIYGTGSFGKHSNLLEKKIQEISFETYPSMESMTTPNEFDNHKSMRYPDEREGPFTIPSWKMEEA